MCPLPLSRFILLANAGGDVYCIYLTPSKGISERRPSQQHRELIFRAFSYNTGRLETLFLLFIEDFYKALRLQLFDSSEREGSVTSPI